jgi:FKBP-type peptidyl-prolyl cis-trans isomerase FkpA
MHFFKIYIVFIAIFLFSCGNDHSKTIDGNTKSGIEYQITSNSTTSKISNGDIITAFFKVTDSENNTLVDYNEANPLMLKVEPAMGNIYDVLVLMKEGDKASLNGNLLKFFNYNERYLHHQLSKINLENLKIDIIIKKSQNQNNIEASQKLLSQINAEKEQINIHQYLKKHDYNAVELPSGVNIVYLSQNNKKRIQIGDSVAIYYTGKFLDDKIFDTNIKSKAVEQGNYMANGDYSPLKFKLGEAEVIRGMDEALQYLFYGDKAVLLVPNRHAYGERGFEKIVPRFTTLVFEIEILNTQKN